MNPENGEQPAVLRIGINALYVLPGQVGGTEVYLRSLLDALIRLRRPIHWFLFVNKETGDGLAPPSDNLTVVKCNVRARFRPARILYEQSVLPLLVAVRGLDVLFNPGFTSPLLAFCPSVTVFHDLQYKRHPEFFRTVDLAFWNILLGLSVRRSKRLIAISEATARDLANYYKHSAGKTVVVPHGVDARMFDMGTRRRSKRAALQSRAVLQSKDPYILCVATSHPHKNLPGLIQAFASFRKKHPRYRMVLAGMKGFVFRACTERAEALGVGDAVSIPGWLPREELLDLYENADSFILPSLFEGFGMPLAEALAAGLPTAASDIAALREVGGDAPTYFNPLDLRAMEEALHQISFDSDFRSAAPTVGPLRARRFDWGKAAACTADILMSAARQD